MNFFPVMLYKEGGPHDIHGGKFDTLIANDEVEKDAALANGWHWTTAAALDKPAVAADDAPATRAELEAKAGELGIKFDGRTTDAKLAAKIAGKLDGQ